MWSPAAALHLLMRCGGCYTQGGNGPGQAVSPVFDARWSARLRGLWCASLEAAWARPALGASRCWLHTSAASLTWYSVPNALSLSMAVAPCTHRQWKVQCMHAVEPFFLSEAQFSTPSGVAPELSFTFLRRAAMLF